MTNLQKFKERLEGGQLLTEKEVDHLTNLAIDALMQEPNVVEVQTPQYLVGDVHGQFFDFLKMVREVSNTLITQFLPAATASSWEITSTAAITLSRPSATCSP